MQKAFRFIFSFKYCCFLFILEALNARKTSAKFNNNKGPTNSRPMNYDLSIENYKSTNHRDFIIHRSNLIG